MILRFKKSFGVNNVAKEKIINVIICELEAMKLDNISKEGNNVVFKNEFWKFGAYFNEMHKPDKGIFKIDTTGNETIVTYESSVSIFMDVFLTLLLTILGILVMPGFFIGVFILVLQFIATIHALKIGNSSLIDKITSHFKVYN